MRSSILKWLSIEEALPIGLGLQTLFLRVQDSIFEDEWYYDTGCWFPEERVFKTCVMTELKEPKYDDEVVVVSHWCLPTDPTVNE